MSTKRKLPQKLGQPAVKQSAKPTTNVALNDAKTVVSSGGGSAVNGTQEIVEISSDSSSDYDEEEDEEGAGEGDAAETTEQDTAAEAPTNINGDESTPQIPPTNGGDDVEMEDADAEPSFGDLVHATTDEPIDVAAAFNDPSAPVLSYPTKTALAIPSGASLGTVLSQALKTNDVTLLESCLQTSDLNTIKSTIQRLSSPLASTLLSKLATRLHNRPGRAGSLMIWVQWTLVTHGGYLATQPDLMKKLSELNHVLETRARGLQSLLSLKGKLDMLEAQMQLRRSMRDQRRGVDDDEDDEEGVIYVEGEESDEDDDLPAGMTVNGTRPKSSNRASKAYAQSDSEDSEDMPNGASAEVEIDDDAADDDDEEEESSDEEGDDLIDDEAEETDAESGDEDEVDHDDQDSLPDEEESEDDIQDTLPPKKVQKVRGMFGRH